MGSVQTDISRLIQKDIGSKETSRQKDVGKHFRQTLTELTGKTLAKETLRFSPDRHQQILQTDTDRKRTTEISRSASSVPSRQSADITKVRW